MKQRQNNKGPDKRTLKGTARSCAQYSGVRKAKQTRKSK